MDLQFTLVLLQAVWGLALTSLTLMGKALLTELRENTRATKDAVKSIHELETRVVGNFATKDAVISLEGKYDLLNREMGEHKARLEFAVKHKEY